MIKSKRHTKRTTDALKILDHLTGEDAELRRLIAEEATHAQVAREIYQLRTKAKLSQARLAELVGTTQSVISRLEDADYEGHSLAMLQRIAAVLQRRVEIRFVSLKQELQAA